MSVQQLVFEGPDPEKLLVEAWSAHGKGVRISEPVCVRRGGVLGFFAKLHYRIEVDPGPAPAPSPRPTSAPVAQGGRQVTTTGALEQIVESTQDVFERQSVEHRSFDEVLLGVASSLGEEPGTFVAGDHLRPRITRATDTSLVPETEISEVVAVETETAPAPVETAAAVETDHRVVLALPEREQIAGLAPREPVSGGVASGLAAIGFPAGLLVDLAVTGPAVSEAEAAFARAPVAPPLPAVAGALVAVVGELGRALEIAGAIADELQLEDVEIAVASVSPPPFAVAPHLRVADIARAAALAPGWRRDAVGIVVVDSSSAEAPLAWTRAMLRAMRPSATWAVTQATAKPEDIAFLAESIGGVDALVLDDVARTVTPAAVLATGIPVARLDGVLATPRAWVDAVAHVLSSGAETAKG